MESLTAVRSQVTKLLATLEHEDIDTQSKYWLTGDVDEEAIYHVKDYMETYGTDNESETIKEAYVIWSSPLFEKEGISDELVKGFTASNTVLGLPEFFVGVDYSHPLNKSL